jgi:5'-deoxynucleotidase YfbR-like HD superfamily hydrolase
MIPHHLERGYEFTKDKNFPPTDAHKMAMLSFFATSELLKCTPRKGWVIRGIEEPESVADHMYQMGLICLAYPWVGTLTTLSQLMLTKVQKSEDERAKAVEMAIVHDAPEALAGDITPSDGLSRGKYAKSLC